MSNLTMIWKIKNTIQLRKDSEDLGRVWISPAAMNSISKALPFLKGFKINARFTFLDNFN